MRASLVETAETHSNGAPQKHLSAMLAVASSARKGESVIFLIGSGAQFRTDTLGAAAARALRDGSTDGEVVHLVETWEPGAGRRARQLIDLLDSYSAMTVVPPYREGLRWRLRRLSAVAIGMALGIVGHLVHIAPIRVIAWIFRGWRSLPLARHAWRCSQLRVLLNLRASGYANRPQSWLVDVGSRSQAEPSRNYLFAYMSVSLPRRRLDRLVDHLFDRDPLEELSRCLEKAGPVVGVHLHSPLCIALPIALRSRGHQVVRVVVARTHGINIGRSAGRLRNFFGDPAEMVVEENDISASGKLLGHLKAGRNVYVALDKLAAAGRTATIEVLGRGFARNDGPAWLAVRSRRPVSLWTTHNSSRGIVVTASPLLYPLHGIPVDRQVADLSARLYAYAESFIREHPEAWTCWSDLSLLEPRQG